MRASPGAVINESAAAIGKSRSSTVSALHRLRDADQAESVGGKWRLVEPEALREPAPRWTAPLSAAAGRDSRAHVQRDGRGAVGSNFPMTNSGGAACDWFTASPDKF